MKPVPSPGPTVAVWVVVVALCVLSGIATFSFMFSEPGQEDLPRYVASGMAIGTLGFLACVALARRHGATRLRAAMTGPMRILGILALLGAAVLFLGIPLYFLRLGGQLWR